MVFVQGQQHTHLRQLGKELMLIYNKKECFIIILTCFIIDPLFGYYSLKADFSFSLYKILCLVLCDLQ